MSSSHVLVLTDENLDEGREIPEPLRPFIDHADDVYVVAPMLSTRAGSPSDRIDSAHATAEERLQTVSDHMCTCGFRAHGRAAEDDPLTAIDEALNEFQPDLILVRLNAPSSEHRSLPERRLAEQVRAHFGLPAIAFFLDNQGQVVAREDA